MRTRTDTLTNWLRLRLATRGIDAGDETGSTTVELLSWSAMAVVAIVAIGGALQVLGLDVVDYVRSQLGV